MSPQPRRPPTKRERRIRERALRHLRRALRDGDGQLSRRWVLVDPDFRIFRQRAADDVPASPDWLDIVQEKDVWPTHELQRRRNEPLPVHRATRITPLPPSPWSPLQRLLLWSAVALALVGLLVLALLHDAHWIFASAASAALLYALARGAVAGRDQSALRVQLEENQRPSSRSTT